MDTVMAIDNHEIEQFIEYSEHENEHNINKYETWANKIEFVLALIGFNIGVGSVWRFPIICARNGGGAFIIPFVLLIVIVGGPLYYLEICIGQFTGQSPTKSFEFCPLLKGIGYLMVVMVVFIMWYYQTVMAWIMYYFYKSFASTLPWSSCTNWWNTPSCKLDHINQSYTLGVNVSQYNTSISTASSTTPGYQWTSVNTSHMASPSTSPALEFWEHNVLRQSSRLEEFGSIQWHLSLALFLSWIIVQACLVRGIKSLGKVHTITDIMLQNLKDIKGALTYCIMLWCFRLFIITDSVTYKVVYFTALFPYVLITILIVRGVTLEGAGQGLVFFLKPDFSKLLEMQVWLDASLQMFYSLGPIWGGGIITMSSHNQFKQTFTRELFIICFMNAFTALYAGLAVFSVLGFMAKQADVPIQDLAVASGHGLAFVVYPTATSYMPLPQLWAAMFFFMMMLLILDTVFASTEIIIATLVDLLPLSLKEYKISINIIVGITLYFAGNLFLTKAGIHLFQLMDWYVTAFAVLSGAFIESHMIANVYGADRFSRDIELMTGRRLSRFMRVVICVIIPVFAMVTFLAALIGHKAVTYPDGTPYKPYAIALGIIIGLLPLLVMIGVNVYQVVTAKGPFMKRLYELTFPSKKWKPKDERVCTWYSKQLYVYEGTVFKRFKRNIFGTRDTPYV